MVYQDALLQYPMLYLNLTTNYSNTKAILD